MSDGFYATGGVLNATVFPAAITYEEESSEEIYLCIEESRNEVIAGPQTFVACVQNTPCPSA